MKGEHKMKRFNFGKKNNDSCEKGLVPKDAFGFGGSSLFDNFFGEFFSEPFGLGLFTAAKKPALDIYEKGNKVVVRADLPGVDKENIDIRLDGDILTISGNKKQEKEIKKENFYRLESSYGQVQRSIRVPQGVKPEDIKASYKNGVLSLELPKTETETNPGHRIELD
jgi:HSP20 family protein